MRREGQRLRGQAAMGLACVLWCLVIWPLSPLAGQDSSVRLANDSLTVHFVQTDLRAVIQALGRYLSKPVLVGGIQSVPVTFETPGPVPRSAVAQYLKGI